MFPLKRDRNEIKWWDMRMCAHFCHKMVHCEIFVWCMLGIEGAGQSFVAIM